MRIVVIFLALSGALGTSCMAQQLQNMVVSASGGAFTNGLRSIDWTIGEPMIADLKNGIRISAGFHQVITKNANATDEIPSWSKNVMIYPNPTESIIHIDQEENLQHMDMHLLNMDGQAIMHHQLDGTSNIVDISTLPSGLYYIRLTKDKSTVYYKVVKSN